jgi:hypothetical protein
VRASRDCGGSASIRRCLPLSCLLLTVVLGAPGCGGSGPSEVERVEATIRTALLDRDPSKCTEYATEAFLEQSTNETGKAALRKCEEEARDKIGEIEAVTVSGVEVEGSTATADAALRGGTLDRQTLVYSLLEEDGQWKFDQALRFAKFDAIHLGRAVEAVLREKDDDPLAQIRCVAEELSQASQGEAESFLLKRSRQGEIKLARACPERGASGSDEEQIEATIRALLLDKDPSKCLVYTTQRYLEQISQTTGEAAVEACAASVQNPADNAKSVKVSAVQVTGTGALADVAPFGNGLDGQVLILALVKEAGRWKVDRVTGFAHIDKHELARSLTVALEAQGVNVSAAVSACIAGKIGRASRRQVEDLLLQRSSTLRTQLLGRCIGETGQKGPGQA